MNSHKKEEAAFSSLYPLLLNLQYANLRKRVELIAFDFTHG